MQIRVAQAADKTRIEALATASYGRLLVGAYRQDLLEVAVPMMAQISSALLGSDRYYIATDGDQWLAIGGWSEGAPDGSGACTGLAHVRKLAVHPDHIRRGVGQAMMAHIHAATQRVGMTRVQAEASLTAVEFYHALGYRGAGRVMIDTPAGAFVAQRMELTFE